MTPDERQLIINISQWRKHTFTAGSTTFPLWEQSYWAGWWKTVNRNGGYVEVCWAPDRTPSDTLIIVWRERRYGDETKAVIPVKTVRQAVMVLIALDILPQTILIRRSKFVDTCAAPCPWCRRTFYAPPLQDPLKGHVDYCDFRPKGEEE
jgi:hypothetical protein